MAKRTAIIVHGGAGGGRYPEGDRRLRELKKAVDAGREALKRGSSLDAAEAAVREMEDSGAFNCGRGACLTAFGEVQLDAAVMTGLGNRGAGVGACTCTHNPVSLARAVMEGTEHILVVGEYCRAYAKVAGIELETLTPSSTSRKRYLELKAEMRNSHKTNHEFIQRIQRGNTVGAVALDGDGIPAAAVSTGGMWLKLPGRVGDSAVIGSGVYADSATGAACATGTGEEIIRCALCWNACSYLSRFGAAKSAEMAIRLISARSGSGTAGIITVDLKARVGSSFNTSAMGTAWHDFDRGRTIVKS